jgi:hypothetical protein
VSDDEIAKWVGTLPPEATTGRMAIEFELEDGTAVHVSLSRENALQLAKSIEVYASLG